MRFTLAMLVVFLLALPAGAQDGPPPGYDRIETDDLIVDRRAVDESLARAAIALFKDARQAVEARLGLPLGQPPRVILAPNDDELARRFAELGGGVPDPSLVAAAFSRKHTIVVRAQRLGQGQVFLDPVLRHELAHLAFSRIENVSPKRPPRWLEEGLADWASGISLSRDEELELAQLARFGTLEPLEQLSSSFPTHAARGARAYRTSLSFIEFVDRHAKPEGVRGVVYLMNRRTPHDEAIERLTGFKLDEAEAAWRRELAARYSVSEVLFRSAEFWWGLVAVLAVLAIARNIVARRRLRRKLAEEET